MGKSSSKFSAESLEKLKHHHHHHHRSGDDYGASSSGSGGGEGNGTSRQHLTTGGSTSKLFSPSIPLQANNNKQLCAQSSMSPPSSLASTTATANATKYLRKGLSLDQMPADAQLNGILYDEPTFIKFLTDIFGQEVELTDSMQTLFRGNCVASKIMSHCFRTFGSKYLKQLLEPHIPTPQTYLNISYEIDSSKLEEDGNIEVNQRNLLKLTKQILDSILSSASEFPPQLNLMCICLRKVLCNKYPNSETYLKAIGTVIFLRFINPAIVSPYESGIVDKPPAPKIMRGLMLVSKILQNIANNVEFAKEEHMLPINDFVRAHFELMRRWVATISSQND